MLILSSNNMQQIYTMKDAIIASKQALLMHTTGKNTVPLRINIDIPRHNGQSLFMPAYSEQLNMTGIKAVSVFPNNLAQGKPSINGQMLLIDGTNGEVCAMLDGSYLTELRTGALQGAATDILARKDAKLALLIGSGGQAAAQIEALLNVRDLDEIKVYSRDFKQVQKFVCNMQEKFAHFRTKILAVSNCDDAVISADIITTATTSKTPVFNGDLVKAGTHINGIGAYTPTMQELPEIILQKANKIIFDTTEGVLAEAGDILMPIQKGIIQASDCNGELGEVILGSIKGREAEHEITLFKAVGSAIFDLVTANDIYLKALKN